MLYVPLRNLWRMDQWPYMMLWMILESNILIEAQKEGISSILSVPIVVGGNLLGAVRVYTSEPSEFTLGDVNFVQALAQIAGGGNKYGPVC